MAFYSGTTTAYPPPRPGDGPVPTPVTLPVGKLRDRLALKQTTLQ